MYFIDDVTRDSHWKKLPTPDNKNKQAKMENDNREDSPWMSHVY